MPLPPLVTVSQLGSLLAAFQAHPSAVRTSNVPVPPPAGTDADDAVSENAHPWPWLTVKVRPAIVIVPERVGPVVASTVKLMLALPPPLGGFDVIRIHGALLLASQLHPPPAVTETVPLPPDAGTFCESGEIENVQPCPWTTVTVWPATVMVADRDGPFVAAAVNVTVPGPVLFAPAVIVIHESLVDAVHVQPAATVTLMVRVPPLASTLILSGETLKPQPGDCVTVTVCPATVNVLVRNGPFVAAIVNVTVPAPLPLVPEEIAIQESLLDAVQAQPAAAVTFTVRVPPVASAVKVSGETSKLQPGDCVTVTVCPAIVRVPVRAGPFVAATVKVTVAGPLPLVADDITIHGSLLDAVHVQPAAALTFTERVPPLASAL